MGFLPHGDLDQGRTTPGWKMSLERDVVFVQALVCLVVFTEAAGVKQMRLFGRAAAHAA